MARPLSTEEGRKRFRSAVSAGRGPSPFIMVKDAKAAFREACVRKARGHALDNALYLLRRGGVLIDTAVLAAAMWMLTRTKKN